MIDTVSVYFPGGTASNEKLPSAADCVVLDGSTSTTLAPAMGAPVPASTIVPFTAACGDGSQKPKAKSQKEKTVPVIRPQRFRLRSERARRRLADRPHRRPRSGDRRESRAPRR